MLSNNFFFFFVFARISLRQSRLSGEYGMCLAINILNTTRTSTSHVEMVPWMILYKI